MWLDLSRNLIRDIFGYAKQSQDSWKCSGKYNQTCFAVVLNAVHCICLIKPVIQGRSDHIRTYARTHVRNSRNILFSMAKSIFEN